MKIDQKFKVEIIFTFMKEVCLPCYLACCYDTPDACSKLLLCLLFDQEFGLALIEIGAEELLAVATYLVMQDLAHQDLWSDCVRLMIVFCHRQRLLE